MFYLNGNKSTYIPFIICSTHCPSLLSISLTAIFLKKVTYSDYSGESRQWAFCRHKKGVCDWSCTHVRKLIGRAGRTSNMPFRNQSGWLPNLMFPRSTSNDDKALRAVFIQLYPTPVAKSSARKFIPFYKVAWSGLMFCWWQSKSHFL